MSRAILKQSSTQIVVEPMSERLGAEVSNIDLSIPLTTELKEAVINAFHQYKVLFFRKQNLTPSQQITVVQQFSDVLNIKAETNQQKISSNLQFLFDYNGKRKSFNKDKKRELYLAKVAQIGKRAGLTSKYLRKRRGRGGGRQRQ